MLEIKDLCKSYGKLTVYDNFNLNLNDEQITCIFGESGCGKTTLLNCIAGLTDYFGSITKLKCSYVFQSPRLVPNLTVLENLKIVNKNGAKSLEMLEKLHIADKANSYPNQLSGGQAQRVALARAFLYDGDIILLDEPFASLDLKLKTEIMQLFLSICKEFKKSALLVTHDVDEGAYLAERMLVLSGGKIIYDKEFESIAEGGRAHERLNKIREDIFSILI